MFRATKSAPQPNDSVVLPGFLPFGGLNALDSYEGMPKQDAIALVNFRPTTRGIATRMGYRAYADTLPGDSPVKTLMGFFPAGITSFPGTLIGGYIFAASGGGVYDVTAGGSGAWTDMLPAPVTSDFWTSVNFQNAGGNFLAACNDDGGYYYLDSNILTAFTKTVAGAGVGEINGVDPDDLCYVMTWKKRLFFIEKDSTRSWYLPVGQLTGDISEFDFGPQFPRGGKLVALVNWTIDGGAGIDDHLVAVSSEGDVVIYKGYDPDTAATDPSAFALHGVWNVGSLPAGHRCVKTVGGDVFILSSHGLSQVSKLVALANLESQQSTNVSYKVDPLISEIMKTKSYEEDWYIADVPSDEAVIVGLPQTLSGQGLRQLVYCTPYRAWTIFQDIPAKCVLDHDQYAFAGDDTTGTVYILYEDYFDGADISGQNGEGILARATPAYSQFEMPSVFKAAEMVRPTMIYRYTPELSVKILADFVDRATASVATIIPQDGSRWNAAYWDQNRWFGIVTPVRKWVGAVGGGYSLTVQLDLQAVGGTELVSLDWWLRKGGPL